MDSGYSAWQNVNFPGPRHGLHRGGSPLLNTASNCIIQDWITITHNPLVRMDSSFHSLRKGWENSTQQHRIASILKMCPVIVCQLHESDFATNAAKIEGLYDQNFILSAISYWKTERNHENDHVKKTNSATLHFKQQVNSTHQEIRLKHDFKEDFGVFTCHIWAHSLVLTLGCGLKPPSTLGQHCGFCVLFATTTWNVEKSSETQSYGQYIY